MIIETIYQGEASPRQALSPGVIRMSMSETCTRRAAYEFLGREAPQTEQDDLHAAVMQDGNLHEQDVVRRLLVKGFKIWNFGQGQTWVTVTHNGLFFRGHPDLFADIKGQVYGLEVKGYRQEVFQMYISGAEEIKPGMFQITNPMNLSHGSFPILGQIQLYLHSEKATSLGVKEWILLIKNKNTAEMAECVVPMMPDYLDRVTARWKGFWSLVQVERLPGRNFERNSRACKLCPFREPCWGPLTRLPDNIVVLTDERFSELMSRWYKLKGYDGKISDQMDEIKLAFEEEAIKQKANQLVVGDSTVRVSNRERTSLNSDKVEALLERLRAEGVISTEDFDSCYQTSEYTEVRIK